MIRQGCCCIIKTQRGTVRHNWAAIVSTPAAGPTSSQWQQCHQDCTYHPHLCSHLLSPTPSHQQLLLLHHHTFQPAGNSAHEIWKPNRLDLWSANESSNNQNTVLPFCFDKVHVLIVAPEKKPAGIYWYSLQFISQCNQCMHTKYNFFYSFIVFIVYGDSNMCQWRKNKTKTCTQSSLVSERREAWDLSKHEI